MKMDEREVVRFLADKIDDALNLDGGDLSAVRQRNFNFYVGKPYGNERDGYSSVVTREAMETVEWALPSILRVFTAGDRVVEFTPVGPEDEQAAEQETDIANHYILKENNGFLALHHWFKDALMFPNGYIELDCEEVERSRVEEYEGLSAIGLQQVMVSLAMKGEVEVLGHDARITEAGEAYDVKLRVKWTEKKPKILPVPPDEMLVDKNCLTLDLDEADFVGRRVKKSKSELIAEGFDAEKLELVGATDEHSWGDERTNRLFYEDEEPEDSDETGGAERKYWVYKVVTNIDEDGDGKLERRRIVMVGDTIFEDEETDYQPFVALSAILLPHKHTGLSYIDIAKDLQEIKSTLWRQLLDNVYKQNTRRKYVGEAFISDEAGTLDVMLDNSSEFIPSRDPNAIREETVQSIVAELLPVIQGVSEMQNVRTGISPQLSLDPDVLQKTTMGAFNAAIDQASQRIEMLVRIFAETGVRQLFRKMHQILRTYIDRPKTIRLRGEWVEFNPVTWDERSDVTVNVGLGFQNKEQRMALLAQVLGLQKEAIAVGLADNATIYNTLDALVANAGLGHVSTYFKDPAKTPPQPPPQPDPMAMLALEEAKARALEAQTKAQTAAANAAAQQKELELKTAQLQLEIEKTRAEIANIVKGMQATDAEISLKKAQTLKTTVETQGKAVENVMPVVNESFPA